MKLYTLSAIENLAETYYQNGGNSAIIREGSLLDDLMFFGEGLKTCIAKEVYVNPWSSAYKVRFYNETPKKYEQYEY